jgi:hypothetical protein
MSRGVPPRPKKWSRSGCADRNRAGTWGGQFYDLKNIFAKKSAKTFAILTQNTAEFCKIVD